MFFIRNKRPMDQSNNHFQKLFHVFKDELAAAVANSVIDALKHAQNSSNEGTEDEYLTVKEVTTRFKISKSTIHNWEKKYKDFPIIRKGGLKRFKQSEMETFLKNKNQKCKK